MLQPFSPAPDASDRLHQGDILCEIREYWPDTGSDLAFIYQEYARAVVLTSECDLQQDARLRTSGVPLDEAAPGVVPSVLLAEIHDLRTIDQMGNRGSKTRILQNQDSRYHVWSPPESPSDGDAWITPGGLIDFRKVFMIRTHLVYAHIKSQPQSRVARVAEPYVFDLTDRLFHYLGRVATPDFDGRDL